MNDNSQKKAFANKVKASDEKLSKRFIALDPEGYFIIKIDQIKQEIVVEHYSNDIDELGRAVDPNTGKPIECKDSSKIRSPRKIYKSHSAKSLGIKLSEGEGPFPIGSIDHALYLGRELQKAEYCLINGTKYIQD